MKKFLIIISFFALSISIQAQNVVVRAIGSMDSTVFVGVKDSLKPDIVIDGVKYDYKILDVIDQSKIESITVLKGEAAVKAYNAPNGVILITSKAAVAKSGNPIGIQIRATGGNNEKSPTVVIDGKIATREDLSIISPDSIESINILEGESASKVIEGVSTAIVVTTKKLGTLTGVKLKSTDENVGRKAVVIIDGKVTNQEELAKISQSEIESIKYLRGKEAEAVYEGAGVVVVVKTYKSKSNQ